MPNPYPKRLGILGLHTLTALPFLTIPPAVAHPIYLTCRGTSYMSSINREVAATASVMIDLGKHLFAWTEDPSSYKFNIAPRQRRDRWIVPTYKPPISNINSIFFSADRFQRGTRVVPAGARSTASLVL